MSVSAWWAGVGEEAAHGESACLAPGARAGPWVMSQRALARSVLAIVMTAGSGVGEPGAGSRTLRALGKWEAGHRRVAGKMQRRPLARPAPRPRPRHSFCGFFFVESGLCAEQSRLGVWPCGGSEPSGKVISLEATK